MTNHSTRNSRKQSRVVEQISIYLPEVGSGIRSIVEKFAAIPFGGSGVMNVSRAASSCLSGFRPLLVTSYDSGTEYGPFGLGWNLSSLLITRKTVKGLPRYLDAEEFAVFEQLI